MKIFKCEAEDDVVYIQAETREDARTQLRQRCGPIPDSLVTYTEVDKLPEGEEHL